MDIKTTKSKTLVSNIYKRNTIPVLDRVLVKDGMATSTDMDHYVTVPTHLDNGVYFNEGFKVGLFIEAGEDSGDFPNIEENIKGESLGSVSLDAGKLQALSWVGRAQSTEETRYYLNGICFDHDKAVATNGHFLHVVDVNAAIEGRPILPRKAVSLITSLAKELRANAVTLEFFDCNHYIAHIAGARIYGRTIDGKFPQWERVIPENDGRCEIDIGDFIKIRPHVHVIAKINGQKPKKAAVIIEGGKITVSGDFHKTGVDWDTTIPLKAGFNINYLCEICSGDAEYGDSSSPLLVRGKDYMGQIAVLMPVRVF